MKGRTRDMSDAQVRQRADQARGSILMAEIAIADQSVPGSTNVAGSLAVMAGIAAADAICGHTLHLRAAGESHDDAVGLLNQGTPPSSKAPTHLKRLLSSKTDTQYSPDLVSASKAAQLLTSARTLIDEMEDTLRR